VVREEYADRLSEAELRATVRAVESRFLGEGSESDGEADS
jgi:hypothetical protein